MSNMWATSTSFTTSIMHQISITKSVLQLSLLLQGGMGGMGLGYHLGHRMHTLLLCLKLYSIQFNYLEHIWYDTQWRAPSKKHPWQRDLVFHHAQEKGVRGESQNKLFGHLLEYLSCLEREDLSIKDSEILGCCHCSNQPTVYHFF